jgi:lysophospholipase L1-like esterase
MRVRRSLLTFVLTAATTAVLMAASALPASAAPESSSAPKSSAAATFTNYVALGDSYTAGPLIPLPRLDPVGCVRSTSNYPAMLASRLKVKSYTDVSCSGADTGDMTSPQDVLLGPNPPQFNALKASTDLVTLGIGGNDYSLFGTIIDTCPGLRDSDPAGAPCKEHFTQNGVDTIAAKIPGIERNIAGVLSGIHDRSPNATVLAVGYPRIAPPTGTCPNVLPFADGDYAWLNSIEEQLNGAISDAVAEDGSSSFVDMFPPSLGHDACKGNAAWINGKDNNLLAAAAYHPFRRGMTGVATTTYAELQTLARTH